MYANGMHDACHFVSEKVESLFTSYNNDTYPFLNVVYLCSKVLKLCSLLTDILELPTKNCSLLIIGVLLYKSGVTFKFVKDAVCYEVYQPDKQTNIIIPFRSVHSSRLSKVPLEHVNHLSAQLCSKRYKIPT